MCTECLKKRIEYINRYFESFLRENVDRSLSFIGIIKCSITGRVLYYSLLNFKA